jgi:hypothetical protein
MIRERASFALRLAPAPAPLPHATELRLQCGGLAGLGASLGDAGSPVTDVHDLARRAREAFDGFLGIPFDTVVAHILRWEARPRAAGRPRTK